jgi:hypothetical protein
MLDRLRPRLTYANVMVTVLSFVVLGGVAYAVTTAPRNSVVSRSIKNGQVRKPDLANGAVVGGKVADGAITSTKLAPQAVTNDKLAAVPFADVVKDGQGDCSAAEVIPGNGAETPITFLAAKFDNSNMFQFTGDCTDQGRSRLVVPQAGVYEVSAGVLWNDAVTTGRRYLGLNVKDGVTTTAIAGDTGATGIPTLQTVHAEYELFPGETVSAVVGQNTGGPISLVRDDQRTFLSLAWIGPAA